MFRQMLATCTVLATVGLALAQGDRPAGLEGKFVRFGDGKLVLVDVDGKEHIHIIAPGTEIQIDGKAAKVDDLRPGLRLRVLPREGGRGILRLEGRRAAAAAVDDKVKETFSQEGQFVRAAGASKIVVTDKDGKEMEYLLAPTVEITVNGKMAKLEEIQPKMALRYFTAKEAPKTVFKIDATAR